MISFAAGGAAADRSAKATVQLIQVWRRGVDVGKVALPVLGGRHARGSGEGGQSGSR